MDKKIIEEAGDRSVHPVKATATKDCKHIFVADKCIKCTYPKQKEEFINDLPDFKFKIKDKVKNKRGTIFIITEQFREYNGDCCYTIEDSKHKTKTIKESDLDGRIKV